MRRVSGSSPLSSTTKTCPNHGRLAQLVEHALDVRRVSGSSPLSSTTKTRFAPCLFLLLCCHFGALHKIVIWRCNYHPAYVGEAISLPPRRSTVCLVEWFFARHCTNSPSQVLTWEAPLRGRMISSPTIAGWLFPRQITISLSRKKPPHPETDAAVFRSRCGWLPGPCGWRLPGWERR